MSIETTAIELQSCTRCGAGYRPSKFTRPCQCPVCGHALGASSPRRTLQISPVLTYAAIALSLGVGITALAARNLTDRQERPSRVSTPADEQSLAVSELPKGFEELIRQKLRLLKKDLAVSPQDPVLLAAIADTHLYAAVLARDTPGKDVESQQHLQAAMKYTRELAARSPMSAGHLQSQLAGFAHLRFRDRRGGSPAGPLWRLRAGAEIFPRESNQPVMAPPGGAAVALGTGTPYGTTPTAGGGSMPGGPGEPVPAPPAGEGFAPHAAAPAPAPTGESQGRDPLAPGFRAGSLVVPRGERRLGGGSPRRVLHPFGSNTWAYYELDQLRQLMAKRPQDALLADSLGWLLVARGSNYHHARRMDSSQRESKASLVEAAKVYRTAARRVKLAVERAAFYEAAADVYRRLEAWDQQHEMLQLAAKEAPYAATLWRKLERTALREGEMDQSQMARSRAVEWEFPALELPQSAIASVTGAAEAARSR